MTRSAPRRTAYGHVTIWTFGAGEAQMTQLERLKAEASVTMIW
jgi:hypothetical protein